MFLSTSFANTVCSTAAPFSPAPVVTSLLLLLYLLVHYFYAVVWLS